MLLRVEVENEESKKMAASTNFCRIKLSIKENPACRALRIWHTVNFSVLKTVECALKNLCKIIKLDLSLFELYLENVVIPKWETCAHVFRDNDEVELRHISSACNDNDLLTTLFNNVVAEQRDVQPSEDIFTNDARPLSWNCKREYTDNEVPVKKKKRKSKHVDELYDKQKELNHEQLEGDKIPSQQPLPESPALTCGERLVGADESLNVAVTEAAVTEAAVTEATVTEAAVTEAAVTENSDSSINSGERSRTKKVHRSAELTPVEQQLIDELESLPKPKRRRKHKRKKSKKSSDTPPAADNKMAAEKQEVEHVSLNSREVEHVSLNSSYQGVKKVFDSDEDKIEILTNEPVKMALCTGDGAEQAYKSWDFTKINGMDSIASSQEQTVSTDSVKVKDLPVSTRDDYESISNVRVTPRVKDSTAVSATKTPPSRKINENVDTFSQPSNPKQRSKFPTVKGPVVYRREKLKLRATITPAIFEHLQSTSDHFEVEKNLNNSAASCDQSTSKGSTKKGFKWHQNQVNNSTPKSLLSKDTQLNDEQTNVSSIHLYNISHDASAKHEADEDTPIASVAKDYSGFPALDGPPRIGDKLAFKRLEVSADYTPVISEFKEGTVVSYDSNTQLVHIKVDSKLAGNGRRRNGVFDIHIEEEGETLTNVEEDNSQIVDVMSSFIEVKLLPG